MSCFIKSGSYNRRKVEPTAGDCGNSQPAMDIKSDVLIGSIPSLSPSVLDHAIMEMLNIHQDATGWRRFLDGNPITKTGKRLQLIRLVGTVMIPIIALLALVGYIFGGRITEHFQDFDVRNKIRYSLELSRMLHTLQRERDGSALYVSAIAPETKEFLVSSYPETDKALMELSKWPDVRLNTNEFSNKELFLNYLNKHRYTIDTDRPSVKEELSFYSKLMSQFMLWFYDAIKEARSGTFWKDLVSLQEIVEAREAFGTERAIGAIFFYTGGFDSMDEYLKFVQAQDVGDVTLTSAREYSPVVETIHNVTIRKIEEYVGGIVRMRRMIRETVLYRIVPSLTNATLWYNNMTLYLDALLSMQDSLSIIILEALTFVEQSSEQTITIVAILFAIVGLMCPLILNAVYSLTAEIQSYSDSLADRTKELNKEKKRTDTLLYQMLPREVAERLKRCEEVNAETYPEVTIFFSDIAGFTAISSRSSPMQVVTMLNTLYMCFDDRIQQYDVYKVETIGDAYMVASGLPNRNGNRHAAEIANMALDLRDRINNLEIPHMPGTKFRTRIGCHSGAVVAGVVGIKMPRYCLFGGTVCIASEMESSGLPSRIHISDSTYGVLEKLSGYVMKERKDAVSRRERIASEEQIHTSLGLLQTMPTKTYWLMYQNTEDGERKSCNDDDSIHCDTTPEFSIKKRASLSENDSRKGEPDSSYEGGQSGLTMKFSSKIQYK